MLTNDVLVGPVQSELPLVIKKEVLRKRTEITFHRNGKSTISVTHHPVEIEVPIKRHPITFTRIVGKELVKKINRDAESEVTETFNPAPLASSVIQDSDITNSDDNANLKALFKIAYTESGKVRKGIMFDREQLIFEALFNHGYDPLNLPTSPQGKDGVRKKLRLILDRHISFKIKTAFNHAWDGVDARIKKVKNRI